MDKRDVCYTAANSGCPQHKNSPEACRIIQYTSIEPTVSMSAALSLQASGTSRNIPIHQVEVQLLVMCPLCFRSEGLKCN
ncbi:hypothetical protein TNCV_3572331 [Trichonephila clavipes]|nr:hypothetical protein TNCV_3572331 [Trichonephila clavipes]